MELKITCTRKPYQKIIVDIWPWYKTGEQILCPLQNVVIGFMCAGCTPGYLINVKEIDLKKKMLLLDPPSTISPWTESQ